MTAPRLLDHLAAALEAGIEAMVAIRGELPEWETGYGHFPGGDPRLFSPDLECSTDVERAAHKGACTRWEAGDTEPRAPYEHGPHGPNADPLNHVTYAGFGLGTYRYKSQAREYIDAVVAENRAALAAYRLHYREPESPRLPCNDCGGGPYGEQHAVGCTSSGPVLS